MGADPISLGIMAATAAASAGTAVYSAQEQNEAIAAQMKARRNATKAQIEQQRQAANVEAEKNAEQADRVRSRIRARTADSGIAFNEGSFQDIIRQADLDEAENQRIIEQSLSNEVDAIRRGGTAQRQQVQSQKQDPILSGLSAGISGAQAGIQLGSAVSSPDPTGKPAGFAAEQARLEATGHRLFGSNY